MKRKLLLLSVGLSTTLLVNAQSSAQENKNHTIVKPIIEAPAKKTPVAQKPVKKAKSVFTLKKGPASTMAITEVPLGSAGNLYGTHTNGPNRVTTENATNSVVFIHRNNPAETGSGNSGNLNYDISKDGGATFTIDNGPLNPTNTNLARYPQVSYHNPVGNTDPNAGYVVYSAPTLPGGAFGGIVTGVEKTDGTGTTETDVVEDPLAGIPVGLCKGAPGIFWNVDNNQGTSTVVGDIVVYKGVFNTTTNDVEWAKDTTITPPFDESRGGALSGLSINFDPTGTKGWIAMLTDLVGDGDTAANLNPAFYSTTDGGATWTGPIFVDLSTFANIVAGIDPAVNDIPSSAFDADLAVDANGHPHYSVVATALGGDYSVSGTATDLTVYDITFDGTDWKSIFIDTISVLREFVPPPPATSTITQDNRNQVTMSTDGNRVYFSWSDTDPANQPEAGSNAFPDVFIKGVDFTTNMATSTMNVSVGSGHESVMYHASTPNYALRNGTKDEIPLVIVEPTGADTDPGYFYYFDGIEFDSPDFNKTITSSTGVGTYLSVKNLPKTDLFFVKQNVPNPFSDYTNIEISLNKSANVTLAVYNTLGQKINEQVINKMAPGNHVFTVDAAKLSSGIYLYTVTAGGQVKTNRMIVK